MLNIIDPHIIQWKSLFHPFFALKWYPGISAFNWTMMMHIAIVSKYILVTKCSLGGQRESSKSHTQKSSPKMNWSCNSSQGATGPMESVFPLQKGDGC